MPFSYKSVNFCLNNDRIKCSDCTLGLVIFFSGSVTCNVSFRFQCLICTFLPFSSIKLFLLSVFLTLLVRFTLFSNWRKQKIKINKIKWYKIVQLLFYSINEHYWVLIEPTYRPNYMHNLAGLDYNKKNYILFTGWAFFIV